MAQSYTRQSSFADGDTITAALFNDEYNQLINTFAYSSSDASNTGHRHDGTSGQGGNIFKIGDIDFLNKIEVDGTNNRIGFYVEVSSSAVEQIRVQDGAVVPVTDNDIDLGTSSLEFKDAFFDGTVTADALVADTADINGGTVDGAIIGGSSAAAITGTTITGTSFVIGSADINEAELETIDGVTAGTVAASKAVVVDSNKDIASFRNVTLTGELDAGSLDISGDADIDGTLEADAITVNGATLNEVITDAVGSMVSSNTETGISVTFDDSDNTLDFVIGTLNQDTTGNAATATALETARTIHGVSFDGTANIDLSEVIQDTVGAMVSSNTESGITVAYQDGDGTLDFTIGTLNQDTTGTAALATAVTISANNSTDETIFPVFVDGATGTQGLETDTGFTYNPSTGLLTATGFSGNLTGTLQTAAQTNVTSVGTLSSLTVTGDATFDTSTLKVDSSNNRVGIGTASPSSQLHLVGTGGAFTKFERTDTTINNNDDIGAIDFAHTDSDDSGVAATILCSGDGTGGEARLGFFTGTPTSRAERLRIDSSGTLTTPSGTDMNILSASGMTLGSTTSTTRFFTNNNEVVRIDTSGNVGIGTTSPSALLHLASAGPSIVLEDTDNNPDYEIKNGNGSFRIIDTTNSADRININSSGNVGIGTSSPSQRLTVANGFGIFEGIKVGQNGTDIDSTFLGASSLLAFKLNGSEAMRIDSSGNVGINTTSPSAIFEVRATAPTYTNNGTVFWGGTTNNDNHNGIMLSSYGDALGGSIGSNLNYSNGTVSQTNTNRSSAEIQFSNTTTTSNTSEIKFGGYVKGSTTFTERMRIDSSGNVGLGTDSPSSILNIEGANPVITIGDTSGAGGTVMNSTIAIENGIMAFSTDTGGAVAVGNEGFTFDSHGSEILRFTGDGDVLLNQSTSLIGTNTSDGSDNKSVMINGGGSSSDSRGAYVWAKGNEFSSEGGFLRLHAGNVSNAAIAMNTSGTERMRIDSSGNVGIGLTSPTVPLEVAGNIKVNAGNGSGFLLNSSSTTGIFRQDANDLGFTVGGSERVRINSLGTFLVGKTSTNATGFGTELRGQQIIIGKTDSGTVNGIFFTHNSTYVGGLNYTDSATSLATSSDERLKENILNADNALDKINSIKVRQFDWKVDGSHQDYGFVAQELEPIYDFAVHTAEDEEATKSVDYASLVPLLTKAIQEQQEQIESLKSEIQLLKGGN